MMYRVGKSAILKAFDDSPAISKGTKQGEFASRELQLDNQTILVDVFVDGNRMRSDVDAWIFVYDVTNMLSFGSLKTMIHHKLGKVDKPPMMMVLANKCDVATKRVVSYDDGHQFCEEQGIELFYEISAENDNIGMLSQSMIHLTSAIIEDEYNRKCIEEERRRTMSVLSKNKNLLIVSGVVTTAVIGLYAWKKYKGDYKWQLPIQILPK